jgi:antitoxin component YwqK of YwqJK toxin-antitoxin module
MILMRPSMKQIFLIISIFIFNLSYAQVENYDLLTKNIESLNIKSITRYKESKEFPKGEKEFKLEFNKQGQLLSIDEFIYPTGPDKPVSMRQEFKYDLTGKKIAALIKSPDGSIAVDTFIYNDKACLIQKRRIINDKLVRTWDYTNQKKTEVKNEFDVKGNLVKSTESEGNYSIFQYDSMGRMTQELQFRDGKEHTKHIYLYDKNGRLIKSYTYLLYIGGGENKPISYYFEFEEFE